MDQTEIDYLRKHLGDPAHTLSAAAGNALLEALASAQATIDDLRARLREVEGRVVLTAEDLQDVSKGFGIVHHAREDACQIGAGLLNAKLRSRLATPSAPPADRVEVPRECMEALAADEHERWSGQARTALYSMTDERRERWSRLEKTSYADLSEDMKELDRIQVRERLAIMAQFGALRSQGGAR